MQTVAEPATTQNSGTLRPAVLQSHLPSLDGMRAISILLVLVFHTLHAYIDNPLREPPYLEYLGHLGVFIFL